MDGLWKEVESPKPWSSPTSFETNHFSDWVKVVKGLKRRYLKSVMCYLFGKEHSDILIDLRMCICYNTESAKELLRKDYKDHGFIEMDVGGNNLTVTRGRKVTVSSYVQTLDDAATSVRVTPGEKIFESKNFDGDHIRLVSHFKVQKKPPIPTGTVVVCKAITFKSWTELQLNLKESEKMTEEAVNGKPGGSSNETIKVCTSQATKKIFKTPASSDDKELKILLLCYEWGSSKGGQSTFNRQLAIHLARQPNLKAFCYICSDVLKSEDKEASDANVTLIQAKPILGSQDRFQWLRRLPEELTSPDVIISHGRKFGPAAYDIKSRCASCKWVHFVHVDCEELGKYKDGPDERAANNQKDSEELSICEEADVVVAVGPQLQRKYSKSLINAQKKVEDFYPGLVEEFQNLSQNDTDTKEFRVSIFGRGSAEDFKLKGFDVVANAVGELGKDYKVYAVGVPSGEETNVAVNTVKTTAITEHQLYVYEYCTDQKKLKGMLCATDLVVMPSRAEGFGLIGLEALSGGIPILVSSASGFGETLKGLNFGRTCVVESDDPKEWAARIKSLKETKRSQRKEEIKAIRDNYGAKYQWDDQCSKLSALFREDVGKSENWSEV